MDLDIQTNKLGQASKHWCSSLYWGLRINGVGKILLMVGRDNVKCQMKNSATCVGICNFKWGRKEKSFYPLAPKLWFS